MASYRSILVAYDGSPDAAAAVQHATTLAREQNACLVLVTVVPGPAFHPGVPGMVSPPRDLDREFNGTLRAATSRLPSDISVVSRLVRGKPATRIAEVAREHRCDLIVMGSRGRGRVRSALVGCTSAAVLRASTTPVLLVRSPDAAGAPSAATPAELDIVRVGLGADS
ncbi:MAG: universal stress protein [Solirubrobacterales bacterium]|nr:universal stress protein [Solirubrobacterales bacterium]